MTQRQVGSRSNSSHKPPSLLSICRVSALRRGWLSIETMAMCRPCRARRALCGAATSLGELVLFRALQGVAGAGLIPLSQATLLQINPPERHGHAMAVFGIGTIL